MAAVTCCCTVLLAPAARSDNIPEAKTKASYERDVRVIINDLESFWTTEFPRLYGKPYVPIPRERIIAARSGTRLPLCGSGRPVSYDEVRFNAFYCGASDLIIYDDEGLFSSLFKDSVLSLSFVLAHEWSHRVQKQAGILEQGSIRTVLQSDCFAGAWYAHLADESARVSIDSSELGYYAVATLFDFADPVGTSPDEPSAHGSAFDRISAVRDGFDDPARCVDYATDVPPLYEKEFADDEEETSGGEVAADDVLSVVVELLDDYFSGVEPAYEPLTIDALDFSRGSGDGTRRCGAPVDDRPSAVRYCPRNGAVRVDLEYLQNVHEQVGDFGVAGVLGSAFAQRLMTGLGLFGLGNDAPAAELLADCYVGAFAGAMEAGTVSAPLKPRLAPGDLDEMIAMILEPSIQATRQPSAQPFERFDAFRQGLTGGYRACDEHKARFDPSTDTGE